jgi:SAM-dependent methyltransferase
VTDERIRMVERGYDALADHFLEWSQAVEGDPRPQFVERFMDALPDGAAVVDLGCGAGVPTTARLAERFAVTGVDISAEQLRRACRLVPGARFVRAEMTDYDPGAGSLDGATACYSLTHLPADRQPAMLRRIAGWLRPGGLVLASLGTGGGDWSGEWLGVPMFFSSIEPASARAALTEAGLVIELDETVTIREPEGDATFLWLMATRRAFRAPSGRRARSG